MQLTADLSGLEPETRAGVIKRLQHEDQARYALGLVEQTRLKQLYDRAGIGDWKGEIGPAAMVLSRDQWQRAMQRYGAMIFMDPEFVPWLVKHNPDMRVKAIGTKIQVGYGGKSKVQCPKSKVLSPESKV